MPPRLKALRLGSLILSKPQYSPVTPLLAPFLLPVQQRPISILSQLSDTDGAYKKKIRRGRGPASGKGKTAGRGQKGQKAHSGNIPKDFEGGQTRRALTTPVRGRNKFHAFRADMSSVNLDRIQSWIDQGRIDPTKPITMRELAKSRCLHGVKKDGVKLLGRNADHLKSPINIIISRASASAIAAIEAAGGTVTTRFYSPMAIKRVMGGESHPTISLQADAELMVRAVPASSSQDLKALMAASDASDEAKSTALQAVYEKVVRDKYKYRLPDATSRRDIEYYRDPAHRGYLAYTVKKGESPSLYFKLPGKVVYKDGQTERKQAAKASAENKIF